MLRSVSAAVIVALGASAVSCTDTSGSDGDTPRPAIIVSNMEPLLDEAIAIELTGMPPHEQVVLQLELDFTGARWVSRATFTSDGSGRVDVGAQAPVRGDYTGVDGMGLFWSARRHQSLDHQAAVRDRAQLTALVGDREAAATTVSRKREADGVTSQPVRDAGLVGTLFVPPGTGRHPAIPVLGGSEGGLSTESRARLYASHGYTALALAYFDVNGLEQLPRRLFEIPFEYFLGALDWLRAIRRWIRSASVSRAGHAAPRPRWRWPRSTQRSRRLSPMRRATSPGPGSQPRTARHGRSEVSPFRTCRTPPPA